MHRYHIRSDQISTVFVESIHIHWVEAKTVVKYLSNATNYCTSYEAGGNDIEI